MITREIPQLPEPQPTLFDMLVEDPTAVSQLARLEDLRESLNHFSSMNASAVAIEPDMRYGSERQFDPTNTADARRADQEAEHDLAYAYFARAYFGAPALRGAGVGQSDMHKEAWTQFQYFKRRYESPRHTDQRVTYWKQLTNQIAELHAEEPPYRLGRITPNSPNYPKTLGEDDEREATLDTQTKLRVLSERDARAGFLPTTHREKNSAVALLDYMGETVRGRRKPDKIDNQLTEIYERQVSKRNQKYAKAKKTAREAEEELAKIEGRPANFVWDGPTVTEIGEESRAVAVDTVRSVINEWDDYRANALYSMNTLLDLKKLAMNAGSPRTKLSELLKDPEAQGIDVQPLLRYIDLRFFRDSGELPPFDPLRTRELRPAPPEFTTKNKIVLDPYLNVPDRRAFDEEFKAIVEAIDVATVRELITDAVTDSRKRHLFFTRAINGVSGTYAEFARGVSRASRIAA